MNRRGTKDAENAKREKRYIETGKRDSAVIGRCIGNGGHAAHRAMSASSAFVRLPHFFGGRHAAGGTR